ncbi:unnamed protein product [Vitrella brassicaformis CCMP3155]|uniref:C3H1-type domain-containing protein n=1 Tax=Vitrella brassicaformis (strain CCMP3155) TaxID=1169540 RepID=A0A0G4EN67_VITBC|nr:unnamed protein product [Vitrella brassicaformis CCMP3155]|eukprot:CEL98474.1 unnamed protein product [Vitrella brassicaformis CCMP3155]
MSPMEAVRVCIRLEGHDEQVLAGPVPVEIDPLWTVNETKRRLMAVLPMSASQHPDPKMYQIYRRDAHDEALVHGPIKDMRSFRYASSDDTGTPTPTTVTVAEDEPSVEDNQANEDEDQPSDAVNATALYDAATRHENILYKLKPCDHFEQGYCPGGDTCTFAHGPAEQRCYRWLVKGTCVEGGRCSLIHARPPMFMPLIGPRLRPCSFIYPDGSGCKYGVTCWFTHSRDEERLAERALGSNSAAPPDGQERLATFAPPTFGDDDVAPPPPLSPMFEYEESDAINDGTAALVLPPRPSYPAPTRDSNGVSGTASGPEGDVVDEASRVSKLEREVAALSAELARERQAKEDEKDKR